MTDSKPKTTNDPVESYMSAWPKSAEDVSGHYHPGPESKPLSDEERLLVDICRENAKQAETIAQRNASLETYERTIDSLNELRVGLEQRLDAWKENSDSWQKQAEEQAETITRLREAMQWALRYLDGEEGAEPIDAKIALRMALKEGT